MDPTGPAIPPWCRWTALLGGRSGVLARRALFAVFEVSGDLVVTDGACPHNGGPLAEGLVRDGVVTCPWHWYSYELATGRCRTAAQRPLARYPVEHVGGRLHARLRPVPRPSWAALLRAHAREGRPPPTSQDAGA